MNLRYRLYPQWLRHGSPCRVATEILQTVGCDGGSVSAVYNGCSLGFGQPAFHLFVTQFSHLGHVGDLCRFNEVDQHVERVAELTLMLLAVLFFRIFDLNQRALTAAPVCPSPC